MTTDLWNEQPSTMRTVKSIEANRKHNMNQNNLPDESEGFAVSNYYSSQIVIVNWEAGMNRSTLPNYQQPVQHNKPQVNDKSSVSTCAFTPALVLRYCASDASVL